MPAVLCCSSPAQVLWVLERCQAAVVYCPVFLRETLFPPGLLPLLDEVPADIAAVVSSPSAVEPLAGRVDWHTLQVFAGRRHLGGVADGFVDPDPSAELVDHRRRDPSEEALQALFALLEQALDWETS